MNHRWGFEGLSWNDFKNPQSANAITVRDLWSRTGIAWDMDKVKRIYEEELGRKICEIPLVHGGPDDRIIWFHARDGLYATKMGY